MNGDTKEYMNGRSLLLKACFKISACTQGKKLPNPDGMDRKLFTVRRLHRTKVFPVAPKTFGGTANAAAPPLLKFPVAIPVPEMAARRSSTLAPVAVLQNPVRQQSQMDWWQWLDCRQIHYHYSRWPMTNDLLSFCRRRHRRCSH
jgi:hypothetical protein